MNTTIQKWGNSQGLRLKKDVLETVNLSVGDDIDVSVKYGNIVISPSKKKKKIDLANLLSGVSKNQKLESVDWGDTSGKEIW